MSPAFFWIWLARDSNLVMAFEQREMTHITGAAVLCRYDFSHLFALCDIVLYSE